MSVSSAFTEPLPGISPGVYDAADFQAVAEMVYAKAGIVLAGGKEMLVYSRLAPLVRESGCGTFNNYIERIHAYPDELDRAVAALTTNHTSFFREAHHFDHFEREVRPSLLRKLEASQPVRLWSAGCSSGAETWSLAMSLLGRDRADGKRIAIRDIRILANDIAPNSLCEGRTAAYPAKDMEPVPTQLRELWTKQSDDVATITEEARGIVRFRNLNLHGKWPMRGKFDLIFCRNVMIYFDNNAKERLTCRFADALLPGGYLYIGHSERVSGPAATMLEPAGPTIYRRRG